jgi:hypothetical protein
LGRRRERAPRNQPGSGVVDHRHHEDRSRRPLAPRIGDGNERGRRLRCARGHRHGDGLPCRCVRSAAGAVLPGHRLRRARPRAIHAARAGDPRPRQGRSRRPWVPAGALLAGILADAFGIPTAIAAVAALTAASGLLVAVRMYETHRPASRSLAAG